MLTSRPSRQHAEVEAFLKSALPLAQQEAGTVTWYAFAEDEGSYGILRHLRYRGRPPGPPRRADRQSANDQGGRVVGGAAEDHKIALLADSIERSWCGKSGSRRLRLEVRTCIGNIAVGHGPRAGPAKRGRHPGDTDAGGPLIGGALPLRSRTALVREPLEMIPAAAAMKSH